MPVLVSEACPSLLLKGEWGKAGPGIKYPGRVRLVEECSGSGRRVGEVSFLAKGVRPETPIRGGEMEMRFSPL